MRLLLDTHVFLWMHTRPERLSPRLRPLLADPATELVLSVAVPWEIGIKVAKKGLTLPEPLEDFVLACTQLVAMTWLPIELRHTLESAKLPLHHRDPFDRMLIAQARTDDLTLVSADPWFRRYDVELLPA